MATYTVNYNLKKPAPSEYYNIQDFNNNADTIDAKLKLGDEAKTLADALNTKMTAANKNIENLLKRSLIAVEIWAPPNTQVTLEQGQLSFSGTVGGTMTLLAPVSALGQWEMTYVYAGKTYYRDVWVDRIGYTRAVAAPSLAASPWAFIAKVSEAGLAREAYVLGSTKSVSSSLGAYDMQIIGFDHDYLTTPQPGREKAGLTLQMRSATPANYSIDSDIYFADSWLETNMRTEQLPAILESMPADLQNVIKTVNKYTAGANTLEGQSSSEDLFLFSDFELCGHSGLISPYSYSRQYEYYSSGHTPQKNTSYWLRNNVSGPNGMENFLLINNVNKAPTFSRCENKQGLCLGFCV